MWHERNRGRTSREILFVGKYEQQTVLHFTVAQYAVKLLFCLVDTFAVLAVDDEHQTLGASVVVPPEWSNLILSSDVPDIELDVLVCDSFDIESD